MYLVYNPDLYAIIGCNQSTQNEVRISAETTYVYLYVLMVGKVECDRVDPMY